MIIIQVLSEEPAVSRDLLKKLYHYLFPKSVRHDLGEYFTPDWLAEHMLDEVGYEGDPDKRVLDPGCGSGTFLVMAINSVRKWYDLNRERCHFNETELCRKVLANISGFDLNPLAVMASRTNYLIAIRDLISRVEKIEIPVYLCDSIVTPAEYGGLWAGSLGKAKEFKTAAAKFLIPIEIASSRQNVTRYAEQLEFCVKNGYSAQEFAQRCQEENLPMEAEGLHTNLYSELVKLDKANKNGVWARIIKNAFAPLFIGKVDYVIGNPPWVFWNNLPTDYREEIRNLMTDTYKIMAKQASTMKRLGAAGKDISMLFFYVSLDKYLSDNGKLGFVITQTIFQSTAGNEFRRFYLPDSTKIKIIKVEDWVNVQPFRPMAANKTAVVIALKDAETTYPVKYDTYTSRDDFDRESASLADVIKSCKLTEGEAIPSNPRDRTSFWIIEGASEQLRGAISEITIQARRGIETGLESVFRVRLLKSLNNKDVLIENNQDRARVAVKHVNATMENGLLMPYITGATMQRWQFQVAGYYIVPHTTATGMSPLSLDVIKHEYPKTYAYFNQFKDQLEKRIIHLRWGKKNPFYSMYGIGPYTFAPFKVAWKRTTKDFGAVVLSTVNDPILGKRLVVSKWQSNDSSF